jgi:hypothetical protein
MKNCFLLHLHVPCEKQLANDFTSPARSRPVVLREIRLEGTISTTGSTGTVFVHIMQTGTEDLVYSSGHGGIEWKKGGGNVASLLWESISALGKGLQI